MTILAPKYEDIFSRKRPKRPIIGAVESSVGEGSCSRQALLLRRLDGMNEGLLMLVLFMVAGVGGPGNNAGDRFKNLQRSAAVELDRFNRCCCVSPMGVRCYAAVSLVGAVGDVLKMIGRAAVGADENNTPPFVVLLDPRRRRYWAAEEACEEVPSAETMWRLVVAQRTGRARGRDLEVGGG